MRKAGRWIYILSAVFKHTGRLLLIDTSPDFGKVSIPDFLTIAEQAATYLRGGVGAGRYRGRITWLQNWGSTPRPLRQRCSCSSRRGCWWDRERVSRMVEQTKADAWVVASGSSEALGWFAEQEMPAFESSIRCSG